MNNFIQDGDGDLSSGRLVKIVSFIVAIILAGYGLYTGNDATWYVSTFLAVALGSEIAQKATGK